MAAAELEAYRSRPIGEPGSRCFTDGEWVWPEGLAHYVDRHEVRLPDPFVNSMRDGGWRVPELPPGTDRQTLGNPDVSEWIAWAAGVAA